MTSGESTRVLATGFDYEVAFSRNLGWVTRDEQSWLRSRRVAIAGLGGVGGAHLITLTRLGIGRFSLAEFDTFDLSNFNRQAGATTATLGRPKLDTMIEMARAINPTLDVRTFGKGVDSANAEAFLEDVDVYVDGLDFFAFDSRELVFAKCASLGIPATTVAPLGMGAALLNFMPGRMTFEEYFGFENCPDGEKALRFLTGLAPAMLQRRYLMDMSSVSLSAGRGPSTPMACEMCASIAATEALKILLRRGRVVAAPYGLQYDAYRNQLVRTWRPGGHRNPLQQVMRRIARRQLARAAERR